MKFMAYADDTIWLLFGLGLAMVAGAAAFSLVYDTFGWASYGFLLLGVLVSSAYYVVGSYPPRERRGGHDAS